MKISKKKNNIIFLKKTYKKKNYKGGNKLIGQGAYGCVISPAIKCSYCKNGEICDGILLNKNVSKILSSDEANKEYQTYEGLKLDKIVTKSDKYFIKPLRKCSPSDMTDNKTSNNINKTRIENKNQSHDEIEKCLKKLGDERSMIIYNNGGISLEQLLQKFKTNEISQLNPTSIIKGLKNVLEGLLILSDNDIVHLDIKSENIVVGNDLENLDCKIIDFGVSRKFVKPYNKNVISSLYSKHYFIHPPYAMFLSGQLNFEDLDLFSYLITYFFEDAYTSTYNHNYLKQLRKFYNETNNKADNKANNRTNNEKIITKILKDSIDVYYKIDNLVNIIIPDISKSICVSEKVLKYHELYTIAEDHVISVIIKIFDIYSFGVLLLYCSDFFPEEFYDKIKKFLNESKILSFNIYEAIKLRKDVLKMYDKLITECEKIKWVKMNFQDTVIQNLNGTSNQGQESTNI
jgi:serine/threonine protein kinase